MLIRPVSRVFTRTVALLALTLSAGCNLTGSNAPSSGPNAATPQPSTPPTAMAGRWLFSQPGRGQCNMNFGAANAQAPEGTIAPEGGCPGKFYMSRKWTYDQTGLTMRDHNGQPLAQLNGAGGRFDGKATAGETVALSR
ncbi:MAG: protease inhibitor Inh/omp19 family protein [Xanthobacteraceae bacterium]|nr:protease inhibitor Inh/omp19 family protein [Xanthobacteraceae bacterium]